MTDRLIDAAGDDHDTALRPTSLDGFIGQKKARENLSVFIGAARGRKEARPCAAGRPAGAWQNHAGADYRA